MPDSNVKFSDLLKRNFPGWEIDSISNSNGLAEISVKTATGSSFTVTVFDPKSVQIEFAENAQMADLNHLAIFSQRHFENVIKKQATNAALISDFFRNTKISDKATRLIY